MKLTRLENKDQIKLIDALKFQMTMNSAPELTLKKVMKTGEKDQFKMHQNY